MRIVMVLVCLLAASIFSDTWNVVHSRGGVRVKKEETGMVRFVKSETLPPSPGYSQAVEIRPGARVIYVAGQVALDRNGKLVGEGDFRSQATQTFENLKAALQASGASFDNVVKLNSYFVDMTQLAAFREVRDKYINTSTPPASTAVKVAGLFREGFLLEVEAVAVVPE